MDQRFSFTESVLSGILKRQKLFTLKHFYEYLIYFISIDSLNVTREHINEERLLFNHRLYLYFTVLFFMQFCLSLVGYKMGFPGFR